jgi:signal transduction histidine kinase/ligand-binding sensor domain-containing protein/CheY-like chemotaxis protein
LASAASFPAVINPQESEEYVFDNLGIKSVLPGAVVVTALQTHDGYLWVGTHEGLARFDGVRFVPFLTTNTPAFLSHSIRCLYEDREGDLWVGTGSGVVRYRRGNFELIGLPNVEVTAIAQDHSGRMWIGTSGLGLNAWQDGKFQRYANEPMLPSTSVRCIEVDSSDRVWAGFENGEGLVCIERGKFHRYQSGGTGKTFGEVTAICEAPRGTLWFGTLTHGLFRLKDKSFTNFDIANGLAGSDVTELFAAKDGGLWVADDVLQKVLPGSDFILATIPRLPTENVEYVCEDHEGTVWICADAEGFIRMRKMPYREISTDDGLPDNGVKTVSEDGSGNFWLAIQGEGVTRVLQEDGRVNVFAWKAGIPGVDPGLVYAASDGNIWIGLGGKNDGRICVFRHSICSTISHLSALCGAYEDHDGTMWLGTESGGLFQYKADHLSPVELAPGKSIPRATSFCESADGTLYIGTWSNGLYRLENGKFTLFNHDNGLPANDVRAVYVDKDGHVWVGFKNGGLAVLQDGRWLNPNSISDAVANNVSAITEDNDGRLWLGTLAGVMWAQKGDLLAAARGEQPDPKLHVIGFHTASIWSGSQPVVWKTANHHLLFATHGGLLVVDPEHLPFNVIPPPVHIERITIDQKAINPADGIDVPAGTRDIGIDYTALSFVQPDQVFFKYKLEGYDRDWVDAGTRRTAFYANLPSGKYTFRVKACNNDGRWNEIGDRIIFTQQPHFYNTWEFYGLALFGSLGLGLAIYRWRTAVLRRENEKLSRLVSERTQELELAGTAKTEFLENVSHEIRNPLNGLNGLLGMLKQESLGSRAADLMNSVQSCAKSLTRVFEEVLNHSSLEYGFISVDERPFSIRALLAEVAQSFAWQAAQNNCQIDVILSPEFIDGFIGDKKKIETIVGNFVGNAVKYAPGSVIHLGAESYPTDGGGVDVHIDVSDQGPGIPDEEQELIFRKFVRGAHAKKSSMAGTGLGLATCRVLARVLGGSVGVDSEPGQGSTFYLRVPLRLNLEPPAPESPSNATRGTALIVEDESYNQIVLKGIALELGYETEVAGNAEQAEALLADRKFDVIFLDWELPDLNGGEVALSVRAREGGGKPVIVAMTAHVSDEIRRRCEDAGMDEFLRKPYSAEQVRHCIAGVFARRKAGAAVFERASPRVAQGDELNLEAFQLYGRGAPDQAEQAARHYIEALEVELAAMASALETNNVSRLAQSAHRAHALGSLIGAQDLSDAAQRLEMLPRHGLPAERERLFHSLTIAAAALKEKLKPATPDAGPPG